MLEIQPKISHEGSKPSSGSTRRAITPRGAPAARRTVATWFMGPAVSAKPSHEARVGEWAARRFGGTVDKDLATSINDSFTFDGALHLRRGVRLAKVTRGCGKIFDSSAGLLAHYELSEVTEKFGYFLSHNWSIPRRSKYLALCIAFNFRLSLFVGFSLVILISILTSQGLTPIFMGQDRESSMLGRTLVTPAMAFTLLFGSDIMSLLGLKQSPIVFLDKACIHQTDQVEKTKGISKLGAFLDYSDRMLILYADIYLRKLWTIYEVATFLSLRSISAMEVLDVELSAVISAALPWGYLYTVTMMFWYYHISSDPGFFRDGILCLYSVLFMMILRRWARKKVRTIAQLKDFDLNDCVCAVEADREIIYTKIADLTRAVHQDLRDASVAEALEAFNEQVRKRMPLAFGYIFGTVTLSYEHLVFISLILCGGETADYAYFDESTPRNQAVALWLQQMVWCFSLYPALVCSAEVSASTCLRLHHHFDLVWILFCIAVLAVPFSLVHYLLKELVERSIDDDDDSFLLCIFVTTATTLGTWAFVACQKCSRTRVAQDLDAELPQFEGSSGSPGWESAEDENPPGVEQQPTSETIPGECSSDLDDDRSVFSM